MLHRTAALALVVVATFAGAEHSRAQVPGPESAIAEVRAMLDNYLAAFGDVERFVAHFDTSSDFSDVENGRVKGWPEHERDIRGFFARATDLAAAWEAAPRVTLLAPTVAAATGVARYRFTMSDGKRFDNRSATTYVLRYRDRVWRIVHAHGSPAAPPN